MTKSAAIRFFGNASSLAKALGVTKQAVSRWESIPDVRQYQIEVITKGKLKADRKGIAA